MNFKLLNRETIAAEDKYGVLFSTGSLHRTRLPKSSIESSIF